MALALLGPLPARAGEPPAPWRAQEALGPAWLRYGLEHRSRFEHLDDDFRTSNPGDATGWSLRTLLSAEARLGPLVIGAEGIDARIVATDGTPLNTGLVDPVDLLQGYVGLRAEGLLADGDRAALIVGRQTLDLGSRRLVARNEFRNTINTFTGLGVAWTSREGDHASGFVGAPVVRLPSDPEDLRERPVALDRADPASPFWAVLVRSRPLAGRVALESYAIGLAERDGDLAATTDRRLTTPGIRVIRAPAANALDGQLEAAAQLGRSRASADPADTTDLDQRAWTVHASVGYRADLPGEPRVAVAYDAARGDRDPEDGVQQRFDPLFGARRFEWGPTGLYGALARSNTRSPALRLEARPHRVVDGFAAWRACWLQAARDAWTPAGLRDPTGRSGTFVGQQVEGRVRWQVAPGNLSLEVGGAVFVRGAFARTAPGGEAGPTTYGYGQLTGTL